LASPRSTATPATGLRPAEVGDERQLNQFGGESRQALGRAKAQLLGDDRRDPADERFLGRGRATLVARRLGTKEAGEVLDQAQVAGSAVGAGGRAPGSSSTFSPRGIGGGEVERRLDRRHHLGRPRARLPQASRTMT
jgi:hypothetical protein